MAEKRENKKPSKRMASESSDEESLSTDLVEIRSDEGSPPQGYQEPSTVAGAEGYQEPSAVAGAEGIAVASAQGSSKLKTLYNSLVKIISPEKKEKPKKAAKKDKTPKKPEKSESFLGKFKRTLSPKKREGDNKPSGSAAKISKYESAKMHGGFPKTKGELVLDSESSGVPTETTSLEASSAVNSPTQKVFPDKLDSPDKSASKEDSSDEDASPEDK